MAVLLLASAWLYGTYEIAQEDRVESIETQIETRHDDACADGPYTRSCRVQTCDNLSAIIAGERREDVEAVLSCPPQSTVEKQRGAP